MPSTVRTLLKHVQGTVNSRYQKIQFLCFQRWKYHTQSNLNWPKRRKKYNFTQKTLIGNYDINFSIFQAQLSPGHDLLKIPFSFPIMSFLVIFLSHNINELNTKLAKENITCLYNIQAAGQLKYRFCPLDMLFDKMAISPKRDHKTLK